MAEERMLNDEILLGLIKANSGGGGGGTTDYEDLDNKPQIAGVTLSGDKSLADLGIASATTVSGIIDGTDIDSFSDVETALAGKQGTITAGLYIQKSRDTISVKRDVSEDVDEVMTLTHDTSGGTNKVNAVLTVGGETIDSDTFTTDGGTFHDLVQISFNGQAVRFKFKYLVASKTQSAGYENYIYNEYTDTFVETIGEESKLIIKSELDTALSGKQDTLTFDDVPTDNSNNPVKSNGIYDALELKQNVTDNSLQTTDKTVVGAINEHEGDIGSLESGLTNLDNEVNGDATVYPYADVITIEDAVPANLADCSVKIEPVQDLHGQSAPYVGGAWKNKLPMTVDGIKAVNTSGTWSGNAYTLNGCTFTVQTDNDGNVIGILVNGTAVRDTEFYVFSDTSNSCPFNGMLINGCINGSNATYDLRVSDITTSSTQQTTGDGEIINVAATGQWRCTIMIRSGYATSNLTFYPMIRLSTETDATFAPYTNICPITGHTDASVQRDGVNQWDEITEAGAIDPNTGEPIVASGFIRSVNYTKVLPNTDYYVVASNHSLGLRYYDRYHNIIGYDAMSANSRSITTPNNCRYIKLVISQSSYTNDIAINSPATNTQYVPYAGKTYTIALGDTIYGGTVDFDSGVMTVDRAIVVLDGTNNAVSGASASQTDPNLIQAEWNGYRSIGVENATFIADKLETVTQSERKPHSIYSSTSAVRMYIGFLASEASTNEECNTWLSNNNVTVCYPLATPTTIQLTPKQMQLLKGQNTLTASTGDISVTVNGVSGAIGQVQEQVNATDAALAELAADIAEQLPTAPTTDGAYVLTVTVADGTPTYSWESAS